MNKTKRINVFNPGRGFVKSYDFSVSGLTITSGCLFNCKFCYSPTILHTDIDTFGSGTEPKHELELYQQALKKQTAQVVNKTVYANVMTDPYQPKTAAYTRAMLESFLEIGKPKKLVLQTRSPLILKDIDLLTQMKDCIRVNMTIETNDERVRKDFAPSAPGLEARWRAITELSEQGIPVCITATPTLPFVRNELEGCGMDLYLVDSWCKRVMSLPTITHVVVQEFHNGSLTKTSPEAYDVSNNYEWFYASKAYDALKYHLRTRLTVPVVDGMAGFAPFLNTNTEIDDEYITI